MKQPIPLRMILRAQESQKLSALWCWCLIKKLHRNTIIYNFSYQKLQIQTGVSHTTLRKRVKEMCEMGWATIKDGHLHLTGIEKLKTHKYETTISLPVHQNKGTQIAQFRLVIVRLNIGNQRKRIDEKIETVKNCNRQHGKLTKKQIKAIRGAGGIKKFEKSIINYTTLSNKSFGSLFGLKNSSGKSIQKKLNDLKLITSKKKFEIVKGNCTKLEFDYNFRHLGYIYNITTKQVIRQLSNEVAIVVDEKL